MSDIIKLLPDSVANQIAAGEVIQRPASVIKELVENAIDAGATSIEIILKDAGRTLIQVVDNGCGMSETDARLSFERHATSKIKDAKDLFALHTMGFRGEALASIAAISQIELRTQKHDAQIGTKILISASTCESQEPDVCQPGCNFMVKNLFFNVPARRKFLKSNQVELSNIIREFERLALVNYTTEFKLSHNGNMMYQLMGGDSFKRRIASLFSRSLEQQLIPIETETSIVSLSGFVCRPENARKRNALQYLFVNGRHMRHPYFHKAIIACYDQLIPSEEQPNYFLNFVVDAETIDINIHPTKSEIKFENEQAIWQILFAAVKEALGKFSAVPSIEFDTEGAIDIPVGHSADLQLPEIEIDPNYNPFTATPSPAKKAATTYTTPEKRIDTNFQNWDLLYENFEKKRNESIERVTTESSLNRPLSDSADFGRLLPEIPDETFGETYTQLHRKYILTPNKSGLLIIDQYRAHVRVLFDALMEAKSGKPVASQKVLFQEVMELTHAQNAIMDEIIDEMEQMGFEISFLGDTSWAVNSVPVAIKGIDVKDIILEVVESVGNGGNNASQKIAEQIALSSAKTAAIQYGQKLTQNDMDSLVASLFRLKEPKYTPDGKKILHLLSNDELNKMFS